MQIASSSENDVGVTGTGIRTFRLIGLDKDYREIAEIVTLNGLTPVSSTKEYLRVNEMIGLTAGSTQANEGFISVSDIADTFTNGMPNTRLYEVMGIGDFLSKTLAFTIPNEIIYAIHRYQVQSNATSTKTVEIKLLTQQNAPGADGSGSLLTDRLFISQGGIEVDVSGNRALAGKTDIKITANRNTGNGNITCHMKIFGIIKRSF